MKRFKFIFIYINYIILCMHYIGIILILLITFVVIIFKLFLINREITRKFINCTFSYFFAIHNYK